MQYFTPADRNQFVGDCIPFYHDGTYYLYWLLDEGHHSSLGGLGGHQWCVSSTRDLVHWTHHPIAIGIDEDWEKSICTGSVAYHDNRFYAFYATRLLDGTEVREQLSYAISDDALTFAKQQPNPFFKTAPGYSSLNFRDPKVIIDDDGVFHLFVSSEQTDVEGNRGCLVHMTSKDLKAWTVLDPVITKMPAVPECPDYFKWNDWHYIVFGQGGRTIYMKSRSPYGPWQSPRSQALREDWVNVAKTAQFKDGRRIVAGWIPSRSDGRDSGSQIFGGCAVLRETYQLENGDLATRFADELIPKCESTISSSIIPVDNAGMENGVAVLRAPMGMGRARIASLPRNCRITLEITSDDGCEEYGLRMRSNDSGTNGYVLSLKPKAQSVGLGRDASMDGVDGLDRKITLTIVMKDDIIDVDVDHRRCIVNRLPDQNGSNLWLYVADGSARFDNVNVSPLVAGEQHLTSGAVLPAYFIDKVSYDVKAYVINDNVNWEQWRDSHDGATGIITGSPSMDSNGRQWYSDYQLTSNGKYSWSDMSASMGTGVWAADNETADIYIQSGIELP